jgi:hypothetical protein
MRLQASGIGSEEWQIAERMQQPDRKGRLFKAGSTQRGVAHQPPTQIQPEA